MPLSSAGKTEDDLLNDRKSAPWKVMIACFMKQHTNVSHVWLAQHLHMGVPQVVSRSFGLFLKNKGATQKEYKEMLRITA